MRAIIADDEPLARQALRRFVAADGAVSVVAEAESLPELRTVLERVRADILFLDVTMPGGSGLDAIPFVPRDTAVVFTTAHAEHAATAYDIDAVDYLVKPFGQHRVLEALSRVRRWREALATAPPPNLRIVLVRSGLKLHPVQVKDIWRFEGCDDFVRVITADRHWLHGTTLSALCTQLDASVFVRVHRSHIVNLSHISRLVPIDERRLVAEFPDGSRVPCSRSGSAVLRQRARVRDR